VLFLSLLPPGVRDCGIEAVNNWLIGANLRTGNCTKKARTRFLKIIGRIYKKFFAITSQSYNNKAPNKVFQNHLHFVQDMEVYLTLKFAIKHTDIGLIKWVVICCCILFAGSSKTWYTHLALYLTRLLTTNAAHPNFKRALLASTLVNCRGQKDSWFETDWLNEHHNLVLKLLL